MKRTWLIACVLASLAGALAGEIIHEAFGSPEMWSVWTGAVTFAIIPLTIALFAPKEKP